jgi:hypothetical protein
LGIALALYVSIGILQFITLYLGFFFHQQDGWLKKAENQHSNYLRNHQHQSLSEHKTTHFRFYDICKIVRVDSGCCFGKKTQSLNV